MTVDGFRLVIYNKINKRGDKMAVSEAHKKASYKYNASRDSITIRPERSKGAAIRAAAVASGKVCKIIYLMPLMPEWSRKGGR